MVIFLSHSGIETHKKQVNLGGGEIKTKKQKLTNKTTQTNSKNQPDTCGSTYNLCFCFCTN